MIEWIGGIYNIPIRPSQLVLTYLSRKIKQAAAKLGMSTLNKLARGYNAAAVVQ
jgi:hypothetical protein